MCGRYTNRLTWRQIVELYRLTAPEPSAAPNLPPRYNIAPTQEAPVVRLIDSGRELLSMRWGLIPAWSKDRRIGAQCINARAESVAGKPAFREAYKRRRCLVPADGYYEWRPVEGEKKPQPYHVTMADGAPMTFAGLWERWRDPAGAVELLTFTILTTAASEAIAPLHDRMPAILRPEDHDAWLDPQRDASPLLRPYAGPMRHYPVSRHVSAARNEGPECIAPLTEQPGQGALL
jgi:putative SOS response-associated peptidase YedK